MLRPAPAGRANIVGVYRLVAIGAALVAIGCGRVGFGARTDALGTTAGDAIGDSTAPRDGTATGDASLALSCNGLAATCGPTGTDDCCTSPVVPGGTFSRGYDVAADDAYPDNSYVATLSDFRLDKYEITVARFRQFVDAGQGTQTNPPAAGAGANPYIAASGWDPSFDANLATDTPTLVTDIDCDATYGTWTAAPGGNDNRPMNCITWFEAMAFCAWDGGFLPTEAEWNYAASGGSEQRAYPWSSPPGSLTLDNTYASYFDGTDCVGDGLPGCAITDLVDVGTKPAGDGKFGQSDLAGNVLEWTLDWVASPLTQNPCDDCADLTAASGRAERGGEFMASVAHLRTSERLGYFSPPTFRVNATGARCARAP